MRSQHRDLPWLDWSTPQPHWTPQNWEWEILDCQKDSKRSYSRTSCRISSRWQKSDNSDKQANCGLTLSQTQTQGDERTESCEIMLCHHQPTFPSLSNNDTTQSIPINTLWLSQTFTLYTLQQKAKQENLVFRTIHPGPHWSSAVCSRPVPTFAVDLPTPHDQNSPHESHPWWNPQRPRRNDPRHWPSNQLLPPKAVRDAQRYSLWTLITLWQFVCSWEMWEGLHRVTS